jgi:uncharacterized NAD(P)/FAD-binding protein YdhS
VKTVAIIGGGFCGTMAAVNLLRLSNSPLHVVIINCGSPLGRGVAYGTRRAEHLLNVAARNMSAFADRPNHLLEWLRTRSEFADINDAELREQFIPRKLYGDYLQGLLFWHTQNPRHPETRLSIVQGQALDVVPTAERVAIIVQHQPTLESDLVLLATGNPQPGDLPAAAEVIEHPRYVANPWAPINFLNVDPRENVILLGAGLTMVDAFLTLSELGWQGAISAVSRTGLMPLSHFQGIPYPDFPPADPTKLGLEGLKKLMEEHCQRLRDRGENPAIVVDKLRPFTQRVWQSFNREEKELFCRELRTRWNVMRHRIPSTVHERLTAAMSTGKLQVVKGRIAGMSGRDAQIEVRVEGAGPDRPTTTLQAGWVINCTGPQESYRNSTSLLFQKLLDRGLVQVDDMDMGIRVESRFQVVDGGGYPSSFLYAIGPLLKGSFWETTAVPELRVQAQGAAGSMLAALEGAVSRDWFAEMWVDVVEYVI